MATGIAGAGLRWGSALGFIIPPLIFKGLSPSDDLDKIAQRFKIYDSVLVIVSAVCFLLFYFLYQTDNEHGSAAERNDFSY